MQSNEDKKFDLSSLPRGAIGIKGLPVNRNARLPSIRSPRDLTLGSQPKRTFLPNIPVRREKRSTETIGDTLQPKTKTAQEIRNQSSNERGRGRGRGRGNIIQTDGSVFGEGFSADMVSRKDKQRESYQSSTKARSSSSGKAQVKKEQLESDLSRVNEGLGHLLRDDFIDDGDDDSDILKPVIFPIEKTPKKEEKKENIEEQKSFNPAVANDLGFDIEKVSKFIKKEKGVEEERIPIPATVTEMIDNDVSKLFNNSFSQMLLLQFPQCVTVEDKSRDNEMNGAYNTEKITSGENNSNDQKRSTTSLASVPDGCIGKLQLMKSGKVRLVLGDLKFDLDSVTPLNSKHEVVSVRTDANTGDLVVLGNMSQKLKFAPDVDNLLS